MTQDQIARLRERLVAIPKALIYKAPTGNAFISAEVLVGEICHDAAAIIDQLRSEADARIKRNQDLMHHVAELREQLDQLQDEVAHLQHELLISARDYINRGGQLAYKDKLLSMAREASEAVANCETFDEHGNHRGWMLNRLDRAATKVRSFLTALQDGAKEPQREMAEEEQRAHDFFQGSQWKDKPHE